MSRILIFHISNFGGHKKASENIKEALSFKNPYSEIINLNGFGYVSPRIEKFVDSVYSLTIKYSPNLWGKVYDRKKVVKSLAPLRKAINSLAIPKFLQLIDEFKPKVVFATQAFPCGIMADLKKKYKMDIILIGVVTDYYPHRFWIHQEVDVYTVACNEAKAILMKEGIEENKIKVFGIPISVKFLNTYSKEAISKEFGFFPDLKTVILMGGGLGIGPIEKIAELLDEIEEKFQLIVVCGKNKKLFSWFKRKYKSFKKPIFYFGYVDFVNKLMDFSDIIISKAGGLSTSEALAKGLATILVNSIPGQEKRNVQYLHTKQAILEAKTIDEVPGIVKFILRDKVKLFSLKENAKENAIIDSSLRIANLALKYIQ